MLITKDRYVTRKVIDTTCVTAAITTTLEMSSFSLHLKRVISRFTDLWLLACTSDIHTTKVNRTWQWTQQSLLRMIRWSQMSNKKSARLGSKWVVSTKKARREARPPAHFSDNFYPRSYVGWFRLWHVVETRHLVFRPRRPPNMIRRTLRAVLRTKRPRANNNQVIDYTREYILSAFAYARISVNDRSW